MPTITSLASRPLTRLGNGCSMLRLLPVGKCALNFIRQVNSRVAQWVLTMVRMWFLHHWETVISILLLVDRGIIVRMILIMLWCHLRATLPLLIIPLFELWPAARAFLILAVTPMAAFGGERLRGRCPRLLWPLSRRWVISALRSALIGIVYITFFTPVLLIEPLHPWQVMALGASERLLSTR